jgi:hypothetical protein
MMLFRADLPREFDDAPIADHFGNFYGSHVERMDQGMRAVTVP